MMTLPVTYKRKLAKMVAGATLVTLGFPAQAALTAEQKVFAMHAAAGAVGWGLVSTIDTLLSTYANSSTNLSTTMAGVATTICGTTGSVALAYWSPPKDTYDVLALGASLIKGGAVQGIGAVCGWATNYGIVATQRDAVHRRILGAVATDQFAAFRINYEVNQFALDVTYASQAIESYKSARNQLKRAQDFWNYCERAHQSGTMNNLSLWYDQCLPTLWHEIPRLQSQVDAAYAHVKDAYAKVATTYQDFSDYAQVGYLPENPNR